MNPEPPAPCVFDTLETTFCLIADGPGALHLDGRSLGVGLPARAVPLVELRRYLLDPRLAFDDRDAVLREVVQRAQRDGGTWLVGLAGVVLPGLRRATRRLTKAWPDRAAELEAEALAGFVAEVARFDPSEERVAARLVSRAVHHARRLLREEIAHTDRVELHYESAPPPPLVSHPDLVLARAVRQGVVSRDEAELVGATRLGGVSLATLAAERGVPYDRLRKRRRTAELRLASWLGEKNPAGSSDRAPESPVSKCGPTPGGATNPPPVVSVPTEKEVRAPGSRSSRDPVGPSNRQGGAPCPYRCCAAEVAS